MADRFAHRDKHRDGIARPSDLNSIAPYIGGRVAKYIGPNGEVEATQREDGDWLVRRGTDKPLLYDPRAFERDFTQVFPRVVQGPDVHGAVDVDWVA